MTNSFSPPPLRDLSSGNSPRRVRRLVVAFPLLVLFLSSLACGSFVPRPTPVPRPTATPTTEETAANGNASATLPPALATSVPTREVPTPTSTPTPAPGTVLAVGQSARVVAPQGLNARQTASASGERVGRYAPNSIVSVLEGPVDADSYRWWRVGNNELAGWVAEGDGQEQWLSADLGGTEPVTRDIKVGDDVVVSVGDNGLLKVRAEASLNAAVDYQVANATQLKIVEGPVEADGYRWWKVTNASNSVNGWAADGDKDNRWLKPVE